MSENERVRLTLEERLSLAAQSKASSPEAAAALVQRFYNLPAVGIFCGKSDLDAMCELTGEFWEDPGVDVNSYRGFCPSFLLAMEHDNELIQGACCPKNFDPNRPLWGARVNNSLVLLGEMLLDQAANRLENKRIYSCLRMTLKQYLDALEGPAFLRSGLGAEWFKAWKDSILEDVDGEQPVAEALAGILRRYVAAWEPFDRLDYILYCMGGLAGLLEEAGTSYDDSPGTDGDDSTQMNVSRTEKAEAARRFWMYLRGFGVGKSRPTQICVGPECTKPQEYFLSLALKYAQVLPDPGSEMQAQTLRSQIFFPEWCCGFDTFWELLEGFSIPEFEPFLKECPDREQLAEAMQEINTAVMDLYMLWVEPYLLLGK